MQVWSRYLLIDLQTVTSLPLITWLHRRWKALIILWSATYMVTKFFSACYRACTNLSTTIETTITQSFSGCYVYSACMNRLSTTKLPSPTAFLAATVHVCISRLRNYHHPQLFWLLQCLHLTGSLPSSGLRVRRQVTTNYVNVFPEEFLRVGDIFFRKWSLISTTW